MGRVGREAVWATIGAVLLLLVAGTSAALADGGPHQSITNSGTASLSGDCASCHRAHTATATDLLTTSVPALCLDCHNGTKATTDVVDGVQFTPSLTTPYNAGFTQATASTYANVLGALRGGGFSYALIDSGNAARYAYAFGGDARFTGHVGVLGASQGQVGRGQKATSTHAGNGQAWGNGGDSNGPGPSVSLNCTNCHNPHGNGQYRILFTNPGEDWSTTTRTFQASDPGGVMVSEVAPVTVTGQQVRNYTVLPSTDGLTTGIQGTPSQGDYWRSKFDATGSTTWLNLANSPDPMNTGWVTGTPVNVGDIATKTLLASAITAGSTSLTVVSRTGFPSSGQFTIRIDLEQMLVTAGASTQTWTVTRGYNRSTPAIHGTTSWVYQPLRNTSGLMTAWCIQCHSRYNGQSVPVYDANGDLVDSLPSSVQPVDPNDPIFLYKHGTENWGCEQCHVSHGSNAVLSAVGSMTMEAPGGMLPPTVAGAGAGTAVSGDSRLLKIDNTGTCSMCHDPTHSLQLPIYTGPQPTPGI